MKVKVFEIVGKYAVSMEKGSVLLARVNKVLETNSSIELDFAGVEVCATPFFNASISCLLSSRSITELQSVLSVVNITDVHRQLLNTSIANAIEYYKNKI